MRHLRHIVTDYNSFTANYNSFTANVRGIIKLFNATRYNLSRFYKNL